MGFDTLIRKQVRAAFKAAGDLVDDVVFVQKLTQAFDFNTGVASSATSVTKTVKGLMVVKKKDRGAPQTDASIGLSMQFIAEDLTDPTIYDTMTYKAQVWKLVPPYQNDGYLITINFARSA